MEKYMIAVIVLVSLISLFALIVVVFDIVGDIKSKKQGQVQPQKMNTQVVIQKEVEEPILVEEVKADESVVTINRNQETFRERLANLDQQFIDYCLDIEESLTKMNIVRKFETKKYVDYKIGNARIVRILVKRNALMCEFIFTDSNFKQYIKTNKVDIVTKPVIIKIIDEQSLTVVKDSIKIAIDTIMEEKKIKRKEVVAI